jgi:ABC-type uncharacterized transport system permease subunit
MILLSILLIALFAAGLWLALSHLGMAADAPWLAAHIVSAVGAYALFAAAVVCAWLFGLQERNLRRNISAFPNKPLLTLERWMFVCVFAGFILLTLSLAVGAMAGGAAFVARPQHKTIFAIISWLTFAALLVGHWRLGWRGKQAVRMLYWGAAFLLLSYVGTHFVWAVILKRGMGGV